MSDVAIGRISADGLSKAVFEFTYEYGKLRYTSHYVYNRSSRRDKFADEVESKVLSYDDWCDKNHREPEDYSEYDEDYQAYRSKHNPIEQRTRQ